MTEEEIRIVAETLAARSGSASSEHEKDPLPTPPMDRHRARAAIAALDRFRKDTKALCSQDNARGRARKHKPAERAPDGECAAVAEDDRFGDRRTYPSRIIKIEGGRAYLKPILRACTDWISIESLGPPDTEALPEKGIISPKRPDPDP